MLNPSEIDKIFKPRERDDPRVRRLYKHAHKLASAINAECPESREKALSITSLQSALLWAAQAIILHGDWRTPTTQIPEEGSARQAIRAIEKEFAEKLVSASAGETSPNVKGE